MIIYQEQIHGRAQGDRPHSKPENKGKVERQTQGSQLGKYLKATEISGISRVMKLRTSTTS